MTSSPDVVRIDGWSAFQRHRQETEARVRERRAVERSLVVAQERFEVEGDCYVCQARSAFEVGWSYAYPVDGVPTPNWREHLLCTRCGLNNRMRAAIHLFESELALSGRTMIYITEQITPLFHALRARHAGVVGSEYLGDQVGLGRLDENGIRNEDLTRLTLPNDSCDAVLSFDVLEHVADQRAAFSEVLRILRPGGLLYFTVPFTDNEATTVRALQHADGSIQHLAEPEYHSDPLSSAGSLCFYHFGWDLLDRLRAIGFRSVHCLRYWSRELCYLGEGEQRAFVARKPASPPPD